MVGDGDPDAVGGSPEIVAGIRSEGIPLRTAIGYGLLVTGVLILARIISAYTAMLATYLFRRSVFPRATPPSEG